MMLLEILKMPMYANKTIGIESPCQLKVLWRTARLPNGEQPGGKVVLA
jgi:hypothetical protein